MQAEAPPKTWIRGVNVGGWLMAEHFITPYLFAVNTCHLDGDLCWYPGQIGAPKNNTNICNPTKCKPVVPFPTTNGNVDFHPRNDEQYFGYPFDELTLGQVFPKKDAAKSYMERHWDTFVTKQDLIDLKAAGVTHLRVPMSFWIRGDVRDGEAWITGGWPYFVRFCRWCREIGGLQVWADLHGAPGSENGFDNSGQYLGQSTCHGWDTQPDNVARTLDIIRDISDGIVQEELTDVVRGFGLLNEPFLDCDESVLRYYYSQAFDIVRSTIGDDIAVFIGDMFLAHKWNNGWWNDTLVHKNTYLDSHPYHVFFEQGRALTPRQHIAYVCQHNARDVKSCCYDDAPTNTIPSKGISRIMGEWSAAYDALPTALVPFIMKAIAQDGVAPLLDRKLSQKRMKFIRNFVEAQMVTYEAAPEGVSSGWLFWNFKMEGGAFAEWDFLRGFQEGWIPQIPKPHVASQDLYGSCLDILNRTVDEYSAVVDEYPNPRTLDWTQWQGWTVDDDFVLNDGTYPVAPQTPNPWIVASVVMAMIGVLLFGVRKVVQHQGQGYRELK